MFLRRCFLVIWTFKSTNWVRQTASPMWMSLIQPADAWYSTKRLTLPRITGNYTCLTVFNMGLWFFLPPDLNWNIGFSWVLSLLAFRLELSSALLVRRPLNSGRSFTIISPGSPTSQLQTLGLVSLRDYYVSQLLIIYLSISWIF